MDWRSRFGFRQTRLHRRSPRPLTGPEALEGRALLAADLFCPQAAAMEAAEPAGIEDWQAAPAAAEILPAALPNDPSFALEWGLLNTGQYAGLPGNDIAATGAWEFTTGSRNVVVAVIDSGIDLTHPDLAANLWVNPGEIAGDGIDNDGNGFVDDVHGWDFVDNDGVPQDGFGHGTHVAGIIGAVGNNGTGVTGVNWQVSIMALRVQDDRGVGFTSAVVAALRYATMMRRDYGIMVVASNNSWEAPAGYSSVVEQVIREHGEAGITFVAAAGNNGTDTDLTPKYPGAFDLPNVITVASLTPQGGLASSSNYGPRSVDVAAPGTVIQSTYKNGGYGILSGTDQRRRDPHRDPRHGHARGLAGRQGGQRPAQRLGGDRVVGPRADRAAGPGAGASARADPAGRADRDASFFRHVRGRPWPARDARLGDSVRQPCDPRRGPRVAIGRAERRDAARGAPGRDPAAVAGGRSPKRPRRACGPVRRRGGRSRGGRTVSRRRAVSGPDHRRHRRPGAGGGRSLDARGPRCPAVGRERWQAGPVFQRSPDALGPKSAAGRR